MYRFLKETGYPGWWMGYSMVGGFTASYSKGRNLDDCIGNALLAGVIAGTAPVSVPLLVVATFNGWLSK